MKTIQKYRFGIQFIFLILTITSFFINFKIAMLTILVSTPLLGVFYCSWICPFGFIQDLFSKLGNLFKIRKRKMPKAIQKILVFNRYVILLIVFLVEVDLIFNIMSFDPRVNFEKLLLGNLISIGTIVVICIFSLVSLFFDRPFCNYLCYEGAKYGLMSILRPFTIRRNESTCINCNKCNIVCPMNIEISKCSNLRSVQCINCFQCISNCPVKDTLSYGKVHFKQNKKNKYLPILVVILVLITVPLVYNIFNRTNPLNAEKYSNIYDKTTINDTPKSSTSNNESSSLDSTKTADNNSTENSVGTTNITDGSYTGTSEGFRGPITVKVTIKDQKISTIEVLESSDDMKWFNRANATIPNSIIESQSTDVDTVSGATYSSLGIKNAVKDALEKAK